MNKRCIRLFSVVLVSATLSCFNFYANTSQGKSTQNNDHYKMKKSVLESVAFQKQSQESTDWFLVKAILNDNTQKIKHTAQKNMPTRKFVKKNKKTTILKTNKQSFFKIVRLKFFGTLKFILKTGSKIKFSIWG